MGNAPGLNEITTTTLRNRRAKVPSHSPEQAKTMSAIAHGWKPKGSAKNIPVKVAKEFHQADAGKKYGAKVDHENRKSVKPRKTGGYDRSGHYPGNPGFNREGKPPYGNYDGGAHAKQPRGRSIGAGGHSTKRPVANISSEQGSMGHHHHEVGFNGPADRGGSRLQEQTNGPGNHKQPRGTSIGAGTRTARVGESMGRGSGAFRGMTSNPLRCHNGGHRIGARKK